MTDPRTGFGLIVAGLVLVTAYHILSGNTIAKVVFWSAWLGGLMAFLLAT